MPPIGTNHRIHPPFSILSLSSGIRSNPQSYHYVAQRGRFSQSITDWQNHVQLFQLSYPSESSVKLWHYYNDVKSDEIEPAIANLRKPR